MSISKNKDFEKHHMLAIVVVSIIVLLTAAVVCLSFLNREDSYRYQPPAPSLISLQADRQEYAHNIPLSDISNYPRKSADELFDFGKVEDFGTYTKTTYPYLGTSLSETAEWIRERIVPSFDSYDNTKEGLFFKGTDFEEYAVCLKSIEKQDQFVVAASQDYSSAAAEMYSTISVIEPKDKNVDICNSVGK